MSADQLGWFYFNGQLRYKDGQGWTGRYKPIEGPAGTTSPAKGKSADHATAPTSPTVRAPHRILTHLLTAVCAGLLGIGVGAGLLQPGVIHGWVSWASHQAGQVSALFSSQTPSTRVPSSDAKVKGPAKQSPQGPAAAKIAPAR